MDPPQEIAVSASGLGRRFGRRWAVAHVDLEIAAGEVVLLAGPNGSGKTTLLRLLGGLWKPSRGTLRVFGLDPGRERLSCRRLLCFASHENYLYPPLTALETLRVWARLLGRAAPDDELVELLASVELAERRDHRVGGFSAGMRKRLTLLRTRLEDPRLILLDEPLATLDAAGRRMVERWIAEFRDQGRTVVMASHALERMGALCDRAIELRTGQVIWGGPGRELLRRLEAVV